MYSVSGAERIPYLVTLNIVAMGTVGKLIEFNFNRGGVCIDMFE